MAAGNHDGHLGGAYEAASAEEIARVYNDWADSYEAQMASSGYRHPAICLALLARYLPRGSEPILDAGAGTGLVGEWLTLLGYGRAEALDISPGMLAVAREKQVYSAFHEVTLGGELPFESDHYAGIVSAGVFTTGHVGAEGIDELIRICRPGGVIVVTVKQTLWEGGFAAHLGALEASGLVALAEETRPYASMPGEAGTIPSRALVLSVP